MKSAPTILQSADNKVTLGPASRKSRAVSIATGLVKYSPLSVSRPIKFPQLPEIRLDLLMGQSRRILSNRRKTRQPFQLIEQRMFCFSKVVVQVMDRTIARFFILFCFPGPNHSSRDGNFGS